MSAPDPTGRPRIYLTTPQRFEPEDLARRLAPALAGGAVACLRLDLGAQPEEEWRRAANHLIEIAHGADVPLLVTDHYRLVGPLGLDGVHLASLRVPLRTVRKDLGPDRVIGAYGGRTRHQAMGLAEAGADYVALGPVSVPGGLGDGETAPDDLFAWWAEMIETPCLAEGGVGPADALRLAATADFIAPDPVHWAGAPDILAALAPFRAALAEA